MMLDIVGKRYIYFLVSLLIIVPGTIALILFGLKPGIDFTGGTYWQLVPQNPQVDTNQVTQLLRGPDGRHPEAIVQNATLSANGITTPTIVIRMASISKDAQEKDRLKALLIDNGIVAGQVVTATTPVSPTAVPAASATTTTTVAAGNTNGGGTSVLSVQGFNEIRFDDVGPSIGSEVTRQAFLAVLAASVGILAYLWYAFRRVPNALRYGVCALIALLHDVLVVTGIFAILGELFGVEVDALFITAMLTVIGFSVHDTIVVFDRIRENLLKRRFDTYDKVVNYSLVQTLTRSINTSLTVIFTLFALYLFGGVSVRNFILALLIGIVSGTYSSIFNASLMLVIWENREWRNWFGRGRRPAAEQPA